MISVLIPDILWNQALDIFAQHKPSVERVIYLDGFEVDEDGYPGTSLDDSTFIATLIVIPDAELRPGNYSISAQAMSQAGQHLRTDRMTRIAQVHTHGDDWVDHSLTDDECAYSQHPGSISIVVPFHGASRPTISQCGVHLRTTSGWERVEPAAVITLKPTTLDFRSHPWTPSSATQDGGTFFRFPTWISNTFSRRGHSASSSQSKRH